MSANRLKTPFVPRFGSQVRSSQTDDGTSASTEYVIELPCSQKQTEIKKAKSTKRRVRSTTFNNQALFNKLKSEEKRRKEKNDQRRNQMTGSSSAGTTEEGVNGDVVTFCQRYIDIAKHKNDKSKLDVLRTISRMLQENRSIRQRMSSLGQASSCR